MGGTDKECELGGFLRLGYCEGLYFHPHIHCVIPGGGISPNRERWIHPQYPFFLPVKALAKVFRGKFVAGLRRAHRKKRLTCAGSIQHLADPKHFASFLRVLFRQDWVVYAKPAFGGPEQVIRKPKRGDGAVSVKGPTGKRLKIPAWMLTPDSSDVQIAEQPHLSMEALLSLTSLIAPLLDIVNHNLPQTVVDGCKGGQRGATTTSGSDDAKGMRERAGRSTNRTDRSDGPHSSRGLSSRRRKS